MRNLRVLVINKLLLLSLLIDLYDKHIFFVYLINILFGYC